MTEQRNSDWISVGFGRKFWPLDPRREDVNIETIARSLSNTCRWTGHLDDFYSVAEHCIRMVDLIEKEDEEGHDPDYLLTALLHDAPEAYLSDIARPVKHDPRFSAYKEFESTLENVIFARYGLTSKYMPLVKYWDDLLLVTEARDLVGVDTAKEWSAPLCYVKPLKTIITPNPYNKMVRNQFLNKFREIQSRRDIESHFQ